MKINTSIVVPNAIDCFFDLLKSDVIHNNFTFHNLRYSASWDGGSAEIYKNLKNHSNNIKEKLKAGQYKYIGKISFYQLYFVVDMAKNEQITSYPYLCSFIKKVEEITGVEATINQTMVKGLERAANI